MIALLFWLTVGKPKERSSMIQSQTYREKTQNKRVLNDMLLQADTNSEG